MRSTWIPFQQGRWVLLIGGGGGWGLCQPVVCMLHTAKLGPLELMHAGEMTTQLLLKDTGQILGTRLT